MLRERILRKICLTTFIFFVLLVISTFTWNDVIPNTKTLNKNDFVNIYLLDKRNYLAKVMVWVEDKHNLDVVREIIDSLKNKNTYYDSLKGLIPNNTKINNITLNNNILWIDFNEELLNVNKDTEEKIIESLIYSLTSLPEVKGIKISINGKYLNILPQTRIILGDVLTKSFGINKEYDITRTRNISRVVLYYYETIDKENYYVPVTRYLNDNNDKIKIIIDNLKNSYLYRTNLMSYLNDRIEFLKYEQMNDVVTLSFSNLISLNPDESREEVIYTIANSIFDSLDVKKVVLMDNDKIVQIVNNE